MRSFRIAIACMMLSIAASCGPSVPVWRAGMFDGPLDGRDYPPLYLAGWRDGCETAAAGSSNHFYKLGHRFRQDWRLVKAKVYHSGWQDAFNYCSTYLLRHHYETVGRRLL